MTAWTRRTLNSRSQSLSQRSHTVTNSTPNSGARSATPSDRLVGVKGIVAKGKVGHRKLTVQYILLLFLIIDHNWRYVASTVLMTALPADTTAEPSASATAKTVHP